MSRFNQTGAMNILLIPLILVSLFFVGAASFAAWAYMGRQDYKDNSDKKVAAAVEIAKKETSTAKDTEFIEKEKYPLRHYTGPAAYGSVDIQYPKTWSAYVTETSNSSTPVVGYFHPSFVPSTVQGPSSNAFALRLEVSNTSYDQTMKQFEAFVKNGKIKVTPYKAPKVPNVLGARLDGEIIIGKQGSMVLMPLRDKTLKIWTEANNFKGDFDKIIMANVVFVP
jgi:hypothetical protein